MYIIKCDRCGNERTVRNPMPIFGSEKPDYVPKYTISVFDDGMRMINLCAECEKKFESWLEKGREE